MHNEICLLTILGGRGQLPRLPPGYTTDKPSLIACEIVNRLGPVNYDRHSTPQPQIAYNPSQALTIRRIADQWRCCLSYTHQSVIQLRKRPLNHPLDKHQSAAAAVIRIISHASSVENKSAFNIEPEPRSGPRLACTKHRTCVKASTQ
jgi:hypothetical protein